MTGNLQMNNSRIKGLPTTTPQSSDEATSTDYVLTLINDLPNVHLFIPCWIIENDWSFKYG